MDSDMDGHITLKEFRNGMEQIPGFKEQEGTPKQEIEWQRVWSKVDLDNSGQITFNEFLPLSLDIKKLGTPESIKEMFLMNCQNGETEMRMEDMRKLLGEQAQDSQRTQNQIDTFNKMFA